ncbi:cysteine proteinase [Cylindrobasidium torrendii FP15055 ss-10]|uniref:Cysteine proteinase n=1 Tax=Cylindrobasidium torrendii FP15055 ss-10 TaxID=1314674 RepID=A0A0D7BHL9_9AGAR|nr:cysteine proteinase [Cylindrobasidium torrendii FP15055 ss-10]
MAKKQKKSSSSKSSPLPPPQEAFPDDDSLMDDLVAQLDKREPEVQAPPVKSPSPMSDMNPIKKAKDRFKERQARKAAALETTYSAEDTIANEQLEREAQEERVNIKKTCDELRVEMHEINPDGHCLFSAIADQLLLHNLLTPTQASYNTTRAAAAQYMLDHQDDFLPFLPSVGGEDAEDAQDDGLMTQKQFQRYCATIRETGAWGGEPEIQALCRVYDVPIHVIQGTQPPIVFYNPPNNGGDDPHSSKALRISYHRRMYGLGEHYNSLRPRTKMDSVRDAISFLTP